MFHLRFTDDPRLFWIVVEAGEPSVCLEDPGFEVDVTMTSDFGSLYQVWLGRTPLKDALKSGRLEFIGPTAFTRRMGRVFRLSPLASIVRATE